MIIRLNSVQLQLQLPAGTELGKSQSHLPNLSSRFGDGFQLSYIKIPFGVIDIEIDLLAIEDYRRSGIIFMYRVFHNN